MANAWIPAQASRGVPWALEVADIMQGQPKVSRIPTGGWRGIGAVPSHSYPYETDVPGYWSGMGHVASTTDAQAAKTTMRGYGLDPTACPAGYAMNAEGKCVAVGGAAPATSELSQILATLAKSGVDAYTAQQRYLAYKRTGDPSLIMGPTPPGAAPAPGMPGAPMSTTTMLMLGGAAVGVLVLVMAMKR